MNNPSEVRTAIESIIARVLQDTGRTPKPLNDEDRLSEQIGLDSLDFAQVVVLSEQRFGVDPFSRPGVVVRTFGDLVNMYMEVMRNK